MSRLTVRADFSLTHSNDFFYAPLTSVRCGAKLLGKVRDSIEGAARNVGKVEANLATSQSG